MVFYLAGLTCQQQNLFVARNSLFLLSQTKPTHQQILQQTLKQDLFNICWKIFILNVKRKANIWIYAWLFFFFFSWPGSTDEIKQHDCGKSCQLELMLSSSILTHSARNLLSSLLNWILSTFHLYKLCISLGRSYHNTAALPTLLEQ